MNPSILMLLTAWFVAVPSFAAPAPVTLPSCPELSQNWVRRYHAKLGMVAPARSLDCSGVDSMELAIARAAFYLDQSPWTHGPATTGRWAQPPRTMLDWFDGRVKRLRVFAGPGDPHAKFGEGSVNLPSTFAQDSALSVAGQMVHEAGHLAPDQGHVVCTDGPAAGVAMCDEAVTESFVTGSAHSVAALWLSWVAVRSTFPEEDRATALNIALWVVRERLNGDASVKQAWLDVYLPGSRL